MKNKSAYKKSIGFLTAALAFAASITACSSSDDSSSPSGSKPAAETVSQSTEQSAAATNQLSDLNFDYGSLFSDRDRDPSYDSVTAEIRLSENSAEISGSGASADGSVITINEEGIYRITGSLKNGQLIVNAPKAKVQLVLDNADITCSSSSPICILDCDKTFITLAESSENSVTDGRSARTDNSSADTDAAIFSEDSLTINGSGRLTVKGGFLDGIHSKDDIVITGGSLDVTAANNGIKGKDYVAAADAEINIKAKNDGVKSTNTDDPSLGFIYIESGSFNIIAGGDGFQAETIFCAEDGSFDITAGGGSANAVNDHKDDFGGFGHGNTQMPTNENGEPEMPDFPNGGGFGHGDMEIPTNENGEPEMPDFPNGGSFGHGNMEMPTDESGRPQRPNGFGQGKFPQNNDDKGLTNPENTSAAAETASVKGIKAGSGLSISGGEFTVCAADDTLHSNGNVLISGGKLTLDAGQKGVHADSQLEIKDDAEVTITKSYEGLESAVISISGGITNITASDDGLNASDGSSQGSMGSNSSDVKLNISGGTVYVNAEGDGLDSNGDLTLSGGTIIVDGPQNGGNGALDSNGKISVSGGLLVAAGSSGMAESPDSSSSQNSVSANFGQELSGGTLVTLTDSNGNEVLSFAPSKRYSHIVISSPDIKTGEKYILYTGGTSSSKNTNGLYETGGYKNDGTEAGSFTAESSVSFIGQQSGFGGGFGGHGGGGKRPKTGDNA